MTSRIDVRHRDTCLLVALLLSATVGCAGSKQRLYPDPGLPHSEVSTIGTHEIYWGSGSYGGGPIIESVDGSVVCKSSSYCLWYVYVLPGHHVIRVRWDERPTPVTVNGKTIEAEDDVVEIRRVDIDLNTEPGRDYRVDRREIAENPVFLAGHSTTQKQYEPFITVLDSLGFNAEADSGARPFDKFSCSCVGAFATDASGKCPRCPSTPK